MIHGPTARCDIVEWLPPWHSVVDDPDQVARLEAVLERELAPGHPLYQVPVRTLDRRQDNDNVLFALADGSGRVAVVHLTWTRSQSEKCPWPITAMYASFESWAAQGMQPDHEEFFA